MQSTKVEKVIFIDRDGVINEDPIGDYVKRWQDFRFIPGVVEALQNLSRAGFQIVIISNQAGIGDGEYTEEALNEITSQMLSEFKKNGISIRGIYYCLHGKTANCECRKPKTGLFRQAACDIRFEASETYFIGDKLSDVQAGRNFGFRNLFVLTGHGSTDQMKLSKEDAPEKILPSLKEAVDYILESNDRE
ncbi:MAG: D-glycero-beta-D-manno-heptose 1,7-bisphosphate 7-phosphatase [Candidatus Omnitrophica bacterium]|nr:D-glycero-beta-D-manno-heptose 1,7-bisphosphate 7-phosphatase [Candidatus Omnitrophota bacterium]